MENKYLKQVIPSREGQRKVKLASKKLRRLAAPKRKQNQQASRRLGVGEISAAWVAESA